MIKLGEIFKEGKKLGSIVAIEDLNGGGLNGGIFFTDNDTFINKRIPLFDRIKKTNGRSQSSDKAPVPKEKGSLEERVTLLEKRADQEELARDNYFDR